MIQEQPYYHARSSSLTYLCNMLLGIHTSKKGQDGINTVRIKTPPLAGMPLKQIFTFP